MPKSPKRPKRKRRSGPVDLNTAITCRPSDVLAAMPGTGRQRLWRWINDREIESFVDGKARFIVVASLKARIARKLAEAQSGGAR